MVGTGGVRPGGNAGGEEAAAEGGAEDTEGEV